MSGVKIHSTAIVDPQAELGVDVEIGPYAVVEAHARIGDRTRLHAMTYVASPSDIGPDGDIHVGAVLGGLAQVRGNAGPGGRLEIGARAVIREQVTIHRAMAPDGCTVIGTDAFLLAGCHVAHDCRIGNGVTIANGVLFAGHVTVGDRAFLSGHAVVHQHVHIGALAMIAGLARVSKDVLPYVMVVGDSQVCGLNVVGMRRAGMTPAQRQQVRRAYRVVYRSGLNVSQAAAELKSMSPSDEVHAWLAFIELASRGICSARHRDRSADTEDGL